MVTRLVECQKGLMDPEEHVRVDISKMKESIFPRENMTTQQIETRVENIGADVYFEPLLWPNEVGHILSLKSKQTNGFLFFSYFPQMFEKFNIFLRDVF